MNSKAFILFVLVFSFFFFFVSSGQQKFRILSESIYYAEEQSGKIIKGNLNFKTTSKYNSQGNKIETTNYNPKENIDYKWIYKYDSQGNEIETTKYNTEGTLEHKWISNYDSAG